MPTRPKTVPDFISGKPVRATDEEVNAVQPFAHILVEDYHYPKEHIRTHPQWRVRVRPSDRKKSYPVDIAVFGDPNQTEENIQIIVECKKPTRTDGRSQLEDYLRFSKARIGVWFNGSERLFLHKTERDGRVEFAEIPNIPRFGETLQDVGRFKRKDLTPATNLRSVFSAIRHYLAANAVGVTRDEVFAQQIINIIFCKIYDERFTRPDDIVTFRVGTGEQASAVHKRITGLFGRVKTQYDDVLENDDAITLDERSLAYVVGELQLFCLQESSRDAVGEAFEIFIGPSLKGGQGQFFTPRNVVQMIVDMVDPKPHHRIVDPACGSGGFLVEALRHVWTQVETRGAALDWPREEIESEKQKIAIRNFRGIDKDQFLSKVAKAYMAILGDGRGGVYCENSLDRPTNWSAKCQTDIGMEQFDIVLTNPPFGKRLAIQATGLLEQYSLAHKWKYHSKTDTFTQGALLAKQTPQILFLERCFALLKNDGVLGIVLLESIFGMPKYQYVVDYIERNSQILAVVAMPEDLFQPHTHAKCCVLVCRKVRTRPTAGYSIFMADVKWCGHDSRGNPTNRIGPDGSVELLDDVPMVAERFVEYDRSK